MPEPVIASDMDGTLTSHETWRGVHAWLLAHHRTPAVRRFIWVRLPQVIAFRLGVLPKESFRAGWLAGQARLLRGLRVDELEAMGEWVVEEHLWPARRRAVLERLDAELAAARATHPGARFVIATGAFQPVAAAFARRAGADDALGTPLEVRDGVATGGLAAPVATGERKAAGVTALAGGGMIHAAFGDSGEDVPMLRLAAHPVAVAPDKLLRAQAQAAGWDIVREDGAALRDP